jgi:hypothetical protein
MREFSWNTIAIALAVGAAGVGGYEFYVNSSSHSPSGESLASKPSSFRTDSSGKTVNDRLANKGAEGAKMADESADSDSKSRRSIFDKTGMRKPSSENGDDLGQTPSMREAKGQLTGQKKRNLESQDPADSDEPGETVLGALGSDKNAVCMPIEYPGQGLTATRITKAQWSTVLDTFHGAKDDLLKWIGHHHKEFSASSLEMMENQVKNLKIQRPPVFEEPDLAWRGVGVWTRTDSGEALVRLGAGFIELMNREPKRARFELTRLVAQSWAPCELKRVAKDPTTFGSNQSLNFEGPWKALSGCLSVKDDFACTSGSYSESAWAISTAIAFDLRPPGCSIPALSGGKASSCIDTSLKTADASETPGAKPARLIASEAHIGKGGIQ